MTLGSCYEQGKQDALKAGANDYERNPYRPGTAPWLYYSQGWNEGRAIKNAA